MFYRNSVLLAREAMAASGTKIIELTGSDIISKLSIDVRAANSTSIPTAHPAKIISNVELVDGSDILWGLSAPEAMALAFYQSGKTPYCNGEYCSGGECRFILNINFGRKLWDKQLAFDPKKFRNPQLKITYTRNAGGSSPDSGSFEISADVFDQKEITPVGFLSAKEVISYTPSANANEYVSIPRDKVLKSLILFARKSARFPIKDVESIKLSEDNDKRILWDVEVTPLLEAISNLYPPIIEQWRKYGTAALEEAFCMTSYNGKMAVICQDIATATHQGSEVYDGYFQHAGAAGQAVTGIITGQSPFGSLILPFGDPQDIDDWYDVSKVGDLDLRIEADDVGVNTNTCEVVTEQLRKYAA